MIIADGKLNAVQAAETFVRAAYEDRAIGKWSENRFQLRDGVRWWIVRPYVVRSKQCGWEIVDAGENH